MASQPGMLTHWPWESLGPFKYLVLAPWVAHYTYEFVKHPTSDLSTFFIFFAILLRFLHNEVWLSLHRRRTATPANRIVNKPIDAHQLRRESNWDDQIIMSGLLLYGVRTALPGWITDLPFWRTDGVVLTAVLHAGPVEFLYYWLHRALHHHFLYSRYHSHHHSSVVTQPITAVIHPFVETMAYIVLFAVPMVTVAFTGTASVAAIYGYIFYIDFMNNMGHCNFRSPFDYFAYFPLLNLLMYTPTYHSVHHTKLQKNYSLFMPLYDYIYKTMETVKEDHRPAHEQ
ncbi:unnamed protein product [Linum tenue]|uniref:Fatty acid hydroxylase domain-containing protein n=2 Tax=Linum tenue TaxID=586396 RepID=A0AAV0MQR0_9ROSI|nr:unnamed protein product [Linum tenue]